MNQPARSRRSNGSPDLATRDRLIVVSTQLFFDNGYDATTTREISEKSGIQKASLYHHIDSKEDLLFDICADSLAKMEAAVDRVLAEASDESKLEGAIRAHLDQALRNVAAHSVMLLEMRSLGDERRELLIKKRRDYEGRVQTLIENDQKAGRLRDDMSPRKLTLALMDLINWPIVWFRADGSMDPAAIADFLIDIYLNGAKVPDHRG